MGVPTGDINTLLDSPGTTSNFQNAMIKHLKRQMIKDNKNFSYVAQRHHLHQFELHEISRKFTRFLDLLQER